MVLFADWRARLGHMYERHELAWHAGFFAGGFAFDMVATGHGIGHPLIIVQQIIYLVAIGGILYVDFLREARPDTPPFSPGLERLWGYRSLALHFCLGTLMNLYSIFFLMSASLFSSIAFVVLLAVAIVLNELNAIRRRGVDVKVGLYVVCVFCFWSLMIPLALGRVGVVPFMGAMTATAGVLAGIYRLLRRRLGAAELTYRLVVPGSGVAACFLAFYLVGLIPPVPIAAKKIGVYHQVERVDGAYVLSSERPWWRVWESGDQTFVARPGDKVFVFVAVFSPARFDDTVVVRWLVWDPVKGWVESDRIPIRITGGREEGFRGYTSKVNYTPGDWRVRLDTRDGREIARLGFRVQAADADPNRQFRKETY